MASAALRWLSLVAVIWLQSINGTNTNFPAYSSELKQQLSLSQLQLNNLAFASDAGKLFGWISGIAALYLPLWLVLLIGSTLGLIGYGVQYLILTYFTSSHSMSYWHIFFLTVLAGNSICWVNTVCYIAVVRDFHQSQLQLVSGLTTSYSGLSAVIYTAMVESVLSKLHEGDAPRYLLLNAVVPLAVSFVTAPLFRGFDYPEEKKGSGGTGFFVISLITGLTGLYAIMSSLGSGSDKLPAGINMLGIGVCLALPLVVPLGEWLGEFLMEKGGAINIEANRVCDVSSYVEDDEDHAQEEEEDRRVKNLISTTSTATDSQENQVEGVMMMEKNQIKPKVMLRKLNFWLYFLVYFLGPTLGLVYLNNLGQIVESRGSKASSMVTLSSAFGFFGRLLPCLLMHHICSRSGSIVSGPASIAAIMVPLSGAFFLLLEGSHLSLCISTAVVGLCTGAVTTISISVTTQLFGTKNFGVNHNILVTNIPIGSFLFGDSAAFLYNKVADPSGRCFGPSCYHTTFIIWGCLCSLGTLLALILHFRTRKLYKGQL